MVAETDDHCNTLSSVEDPEIFRASYIVCHNTRDSALGFQRCCPVFDDLNPDLYLKSKRQIQRVRVTVYAKVPLRGLEGTCQLLSNISINRESDTAESGTKHYRLHSRTLCCSWAGLSHPNRHDPGW